MLVPQTLWNNLNVLIDEPLYLTVVGHSSAWNGETLLCSVREGKPFSSCYNIGTVLYVVPLHH